MKRKEAIKMLAGGSLGLGMFDLSLAESHIKTVDLKGKINHSVCKWCYRDIPLDEFAVSVKEMGLVGIDLLRPSEWKTVQDRGLNCSMGSPDNSNITKGFNDPDNHSLLIKSYEEGIKMAAASGVENLICFSGNRNGLPDAEGLENCAVGLDKVVKTAEKYNIMVMMELLNSKVNHPDYQCDHTPWGVELVRKIGSPNFKLLYDIYHMQIMEGDVIRTIQDNYQYIGHYHTGGVPGRNEIDETQELYYPAIMQAIVDTGYKGYVAQEFIPKRDPLSSLKSAVELCDV